MFTPISNQNFQDLSGLYFGQVFNQSIRIYFEFFVFFFFFRMHHLEQYKVDSSTEFCEICGFVRNLSKVFYFYYIYFSRGYSHLS